MLLRPLNSFLRRFSKDDRGYVSVEAMIVLPALLWIFAAGWVYFDVFRQQSISQKANYVIGDMISRETDPIDGTYITNARNLLRYLTKSSGTDSDLRVTVVEYDADNANWEVRWSRERGDQVRLQTRDVQEMVDRLPQAMSGDQLILVETWDLYDPVFEVGLGSFDIRTYSFTRPRYAPQVAFDNT
ncbi:TadE/TadG family type IV pilus assembly protein [Pseudoponticoccus marisrubri]|uniref:Pilus assembly protein n=1 Tax=Pseudoponticoccus marisrubri TaxID=1685382 RepID=A0A0W7WFK8_9RHOB|nr:hypothetical protein [Pseudoponticoccus marisrubri]KUF09300.1 hypothetical protein AVJ23_18515 [Pseudoponticoccus marisrubri]